MNIFEDFFHIQQKTLKRTFKNPRYIIIVSAIIIAGVIATNILSNILLGLFQGIVYLSGTLVYLLRIFIIGFLMSILYRAVKDSQSINLYQNQYFGQIGFKLLQIGFIIYILNFFLRPITGRYYEFLYLLALVIFNPLPETIYLEDYDGLNSFIHSGKFIKENIINWGIPNILISLIFYFATRNRSLLEALNLKDIKSIAISLLIVLGVGIYMIYRGMLFDELNNSSRRKREFMRNFRDE